MIKVFREEAIRAVIAAFIKSLLSSSSPHFYPFLNNYSDLGIKVFNKQPHILFLGIYMTAKETISDAETDVKQTQVSDKTTEQEILILEVEPITVIEDGIHNGIIKAIKHREEPFGYIDIFITEKESGAELKAGYPDKITERTVLGKFLAKMGIKLEVGVKIDLNKQLLAREVSFMTENEETEKGVFARVIKGTVKPLK